MGGKKIIVIIDKVGNPTISAEGFVGGSCAQATASLVGKFEGRGAKLDVTEKPEMYMSESQEETLTV